MKKHFVYSSITAAVLLSINPALAQEQASAELDTIQVVSLSRILCKWLNIIGDSFTKHNTKLI